MRCTLQQSYFITLFIYGRKNFYTTGGTYRKYNNGSIAGAWLMLEDYADATEFMQACKELHKDESDPEFMFQDYENFPKDFYSESMSIEDIEKLYEWLNCDEYEKELRTEYMDAIGCTWEESEEAEDKYFCTVDDREWSSVAEYYMDEGLLGEIPDNLQMYFDFEKYGRDLSLEMSMSNSGFVFHS